MKILLVHNFYKTSAPSGENIVFQNELALLNKKGVKVVTYCRHNDEIGGYKKRLHTAASVIWSRRTYRELRLLIEREKPDVAHFHNIWYLVSPSAYYACKDAGVPVVQTVHNFRFFCANGIFVRKEKVCTLCLGKLPWRGALCGCCESPWIRTLPAVFSAVFHRLRKITDKGIDAYIALGNNARERLINCGISPDKISVKSNFVHGIPASDEDSDPYLLFAGRLNKRKGTDTLMEALRILKVERGIDAPVKIAGNGQAKDSIEKAIKNNGLSAVELLNNVNHDEMLRIMQKAKCVIVPSRWFEMHPTVIIEAFSMGKPVVGSRIDNIGEMVSDGKTGLLFDMNDPHDLASKLEKIITDDKACMEMGRSARREYEERFSPDVNYKILVDIYSKVINRGKDG
ncbi:MAG: glycosyltransferase family 4 protein [Candidatus Omnitrophota bacterium]